MFAEAVETAKKADVVIMTLGEGHAMSGEAKAEAISIFRSSGRSFERNCQNRKTDCFDDQRGKTFVFDWAADNIPAIMYTWWLGTEAGNSIADVLFGTVNPGGKLPMTFPRTEGQIPVYYNHYKQEDLQKIIPTETMFQLISIWIMIRNFRLVMV
jgi:beta-glucosidase